MCTILYHYQRDVAITRFNVHIRDVTMPFVRYEWSIRETATVGGLAEIMDGQTFNSKGNVLFCDSYKNTTSRNRRSKGNRRENLYRGIGVKCQFFHLFLPCSQYKISVDRITEKINRWMFNSMQCEKIMLPINNARIGATFCFRRVILW